MAREEWAVRGPFHYDGDLHPGYRIEARDKLIAYVYAPGGISEAEKTATLIAAVPELLDALREIADGCMNLHPAHVDKRENRTKAQIEQIARAAIAKATPPSDAA